MVDKWWNFLRAAGVVAGVMMSGALLSGCVIDAATTVAEDRPFRDVTTDTEIKTDITKRLLSPDNNDLFFDVSSDVYEGRVMLTGSVKTARDRQRAGALVQGLRGVKIIYNEVQVTDQGGFTNTANDVWINAKLKAKYLAEKGLKSINLRWRVVNGKVYLLGFARSPQEKRLMIAVTKDTNHVTGVVEHIAVK